MLISIDIRAHRCMFAYLYVHVYLRTCKCAYTCTYADMRIHICTRTHIYLCALCFKCFN